MHKVNMTLPGVITTFNKGSAGYNLYSKEIKKSNSFTHICGTKNMHEWLFNKKGPRNTADILVVYHQRTLMKFRAGNKEKLTFKGFMYITKQPETKSLYINLICSKGGGKVLIAHAAQIASKMKFEYVTLSALTQVIMYY
jgi:hypothetical protein